MKKVVLILLSFLGLTTWGIGLPPREHLETCLNTRLFFLKDITRECYEEGDIASRAYGYIIGQQVAYENILELLKKDKLTDKDHYVPELVECVDILYP